MAVFNEVEAAARYQAHSAAEAKSFQRGEDHRLARALIVADARASLGTPAFKTFLKKIDCADSTSRELLKIAKAGTADDVRRATALRVAQHRERNAAVTLPDVTAPTGTETVTGAPEGTMAAEFFDMISEADAAKFNEVYERTGSVAQALKTVAYPEKADAEAVPTEAPAQTLELIFDEQQDPLVIPHPDSPEDKIIASPWFASVMRPIIEGKVKNDPKKSAAALVDFMRVTRQASATYLPQMTEEDLLGDDGARDSAGRFLDAVHDMKWEIEKQANAAKQAKADARRIAREAKAPDAAKSKAHDDAQAEALDNSGEEDDAKEENKGSGTPWSDQKEEWREDWLSNNWGGDEEADFEKEFAEQWQRDHGAPFPGHRERIAP